MGHYAEGRQIRELLFDLPQHFGEIILGHVNVLDVLQDLVDFRLHVPHVCHVLSPFHHLTSKVIQVAFLVGHVRFHGFPPPDRWHALSSPPPGFERELAILSLLAKWGLLKIKQVVLHRLGGSEMFDFFFFAPRFYPC